MVVAPVGELSERAAAMALCGEWLDLLEPRFKILPVGPFGSASITSNWRGYTLKPPRMIMSFLPPTADPLRQKCKYV